MKKPRIAIPRTRELALSYAIYYWLKTSGDETTRWASPPPPPDPITMLTPVG